MRPSTTATFEDRKRHRNMFVRTTRGISEAVWRALLPRPCTEHPRWRALALRKHIPNEGHRWDLAMTGETPAGGWPPPVCRLGRAASLGLTQGCRGGQ